MDIQRLVLFIVFSFSLLMLWEAWEKEQHPPVDVSAAQNTQSGVPTPEIPAAPATPSAAAPPSATTAAAGNAVAGRAAAVPTVNAAGAPSGAGQAAVGPHERIKIETDVLKAEIDALGGDIARLELLKFPDTQNPGQNLVLLGPEYQYVAQSGLIGDGLPNHKTLYRASVSQAALAPGSDTVEVRLEADGTGAAAGVKTVKVITFHRDSYLIDIRHEISNAGTSPLAVHAYFQLERDGKAPGGDPRMVNTYTGAALYSEQDKLQKVTFSDIDKAPADKSLDNGWVAMMQHYFVSALVPAANVQREVYTKKLSDDLYSVGVILPVGPVAPGATGVAKVSLYSGPEEQDVLAAIAPGLERTVDYGKLTIIAQPLFRVLTFFHGWTGNWGLAIILLTVSIKLVFFPLSAASYRSMAKMKMVAPRLAKIREQYADDRLKQNQAMMELYKVEKINPLGGCLPIVIQIPVFISLYWTLLESVELRHAPFYGWIHDLATSDPFYILPALMMVSMIIQTKLNPKPPDPVQAKVMMIMPFGFGIMFFFFPAGLVLYWLVNNILSILQQWQITRMIGAAQPATPKR